MCIRDSSRLSVLSSVLGRVFVEARVTGTSRVVGEVTGNAEDVVLDGALVVVSDGIVGATPADDAPVLPSTRLPVFQRSSRRCFVSTSVVARISGVIWSLVVNGVSDVRSVFVVQVVDMASSSWLRVGPAFHQRYVPGLDHGPIFLGCICGRPCCCLLYTSPSPRD